MTALALPPNVDPGTGEVLPAGPLAALATARAALEHAASVDEVKDIRDKAEALRLYSRQAGMGLDIQNRCAEVKLRAERRAGELLAEVIVGPGKPKANGTTLVSLGLTRNQSSRWQRIASLPEEKFEDFIIGTMAAGRELTTTGALKLAKQLAALTIGEVEMAPLPEGKFRVITADPPWRYGNAATRGAAADWYPTMTIEEICGLADIVNEKADVDAHLYLWTTTSFLRQAFDVMTAWGFTYKTCLTWVKGSRSSDEEPIRPQMGMGNYFRVSTEHVLFGVRGKLSTQDKATLNWFEAPRGKHSAKPDRFYSVVETVSPGPYFEMFARNEDQLFTRPGWTFWGNQAKS